MVPAAQRNPPWSYEEIVLAMDLYVRRGLPGPFDPDVVELSQVLNRFRGANPVADPDKYRNRNGVHMKLANFRARERPGHGMSHGNRVEAEVWERFADRHDLLAAEAAAIRKEIHAGLLLSTRRSGQATIGYLKPFTEKADLMYEVEVEGGVRTRDRKHESLVNAFAAWLTGRGLKPARNRAIDVGLNAPPVIVEAKHGGEWPTLIRQAVGQLYEYRYFQVVPPDVQLVFLASEPVPDRWAEYLEEDRGIAVAWREPDGGFHLTKRTLAAFGL